MANFVIVVDPDRERNRRFSEDIAKNVSIVDGLVTQSCSCGDFTAVWAASERAPISQHVNSESVSILWGEAIQDRPGDIDAERLQQLWPDIEQSTRHAFDGFYAGVVYRHDSGLILGADILGTFPVYYYSAKNCLLVGSSPELFTHHPGFQEEFNPVGLVGILLTMHIFNGETLLKGVKRLAAGHLLCWQPEKQTQEKEQFKLRVSTDHFSLPFSAHVELLDQALTAAVSRQTDADNEYSLLLSGGLDSRMLAGYLKEQGVRTNALTLGSASDQEMKCALAVAGVLGLRHQSDEISFDNYSCYATHQARWEHVANGFNNIMNWGVYPCLRSLSARIVMGHMLDGVIGTSNISWAYSSATQKMSFETFFENANAWGIRPETLKRLLRREIFGDLVEETIDKIKTQYESYSELESLRAWCFNLHHRQRFHVGSAAWALSFGAWPVLPALDKAILTLAGSMPAATIAERRGQVELLCRRFPLLATLPLDRNTNNTTPLQPRLRYLLKRYTLGRLKAMAESFRAERRYYVRIYDLNGGGWVSVRKDAEPCREHALTYFNKEVLDELLPAPEEDFSLENEIIDASGIKSLLGFMLWFDNRS